MKTIKILGLLLSYPEPELIAHLDECQQILETEQLLQKKSLKALSALIESLSQQDIYTLQEDYVETFDRGRSHCLHLFEHVYGESRDRGQAMVDLADMYAEKGLFIGKSELPDYLPLFLEYLSLLPFDEAKELLGEPIHVIATIGAKLKRKGSLYSCIFSSLEALSKVKSNSEAVKAALENSEEDTSFEALDKAWEEPEAFGGSVESNCDTCSVAMPTSNPINKMQQSAGGSHHG